MINIRDGLCMTKVAEEESTIPEEIAEKKEEVKGMTNNQIKGKIKEEKAETKALQGELKKKSEDEEEAEVNPTAEIEKSAGCIGKYAGASRYGKGKKVVGKEPKYKK